jgi:hypothetical protein
MQPVLEVDGTNGAWRKGLFSFRPAKSALQDRKPCAPSRSPTPFEDKTLLQAHPITFMEDSSDEATSGNYQHSLLGRVNLLVLPNLRNWPPILLAANHSQRRSAHDVSDMLTPAFDNDVRLDSRLPFNSGGRLPKSTEVSSRQSTMDSTHRVARVICLRFLLKAHHTRVYHPSGA